MKKSLLTLALILWATNAFAAFAAVQTAAQSTGSTASVSATLSATTQGNLVVVHIKIAANSETCTSVTDNVGNTYVLMPVVDGISTNRMYQAYGVQVTGGATSVTANFSGAVQAKRVGADEYSGGATSNSSVYDATQTATGTSTTPAVAGITPFKDGSLIVVTCATAGSPTWTAGSGYTLYSGSGAISTRSEYKLSSSGTETAPITLSTSVNWAIRATAFKTASNTNQMFFEASNA